MNAIEPRPPMINGGEYDVLTSARKHYKYAGRAGVCARVKRVFNRRWRRLLKRAAAAASHEETSG